MSWGPERNPWIRREPQSGDTDCGQPGRQCYREALCLAETRTGDEELMHENSTTDRMRPGMTYVDSASETGSAPPEPLSLLGADMLQISRGSRWRGIWGIPLLGVGVFHLLILFGILPGRDELFGGIWVVTLIIGLAFTAAGISLMFGRSRVVVDRGRNLVVQSWGLLIPMLQKKRDLSDYNVVVLSHESGDSGSADSYPVTLRSQSGFLPLYVSKEYGDAYSKAVYIARFLSFTLEDVTGGTLSRVAAEELGTTFVARLQSEPPQRHWAPQPFEMRSRIERGNGQLVLTIDGQAFSIWRHLPSFIPLALALHIGGARLEFLKEIPDKLKPYVYALLAIPLVIWPVVSLAVGILRARIGYSRLTVTREALILITRGLLRTTTQTIPLSSVIDLSCDGTLALRTAVIESVEEVQKRQGSGQLSPSGSHPTVGRITQWLSSLFPNKGIVIKSTAGIDSFGGGLSVEETEYLCQQVLQWIRTHAR